MFGRIVLTTIVMVLSLNSAYAADAMNVAKVKACIEQGSCKNLLFSKGYEGNDSKQIVFVCGGTRYTIYLAPNDEEIGMKGWLSVWTRPDGTVDKSLVDTCSDTGFDGTVEFGIDGSKEMKYLFDEERGCGAEHRPRWQEFYDKAITAAVRCIL